MRRQYLRMPRGFLVELLNTHIMVMQVLQSPKLQKRPSHDDPIKVTLCGRANDKNLGNTHSIHAQHRYTKFILILWIDCFKDTFSTLQVIEGTSVTLRCSASGVPNPLIR